MEWRGDTLTSLTPVGKDQPMYQAEPPPTQVWGRVIDAATGAGVPLGKVTLVSGGGEVLGSADTDGGGNYAIDVNTASGAYSLRVDLKEGLSGTFSGIAMKQGIPRTADFRVEKGKIALMKDNGGEK